LKIVRIETVLDAAPNAIWKTVLKYRTLKYVMKGLIRFAGTMPEDIKSGDRFCVRLWFFHFVPAWKHLLSISRVDEEKLQIQSVESGGLVKKWNHLIALAPLADGRTHYVDQIEIVAAWATFQYRYRQARWRRLAKTL
jgi:hypothetical protein